MSRLNAHAYQIQSSQSPYCDYCQGRKYEDTKHYLLTCPKYEFPREIMIQKITMTTRLQLNQMTRDEQLGILLHGKTLRSGDGFAVARAVYQFINATKRFCSVAVPKTLPAMHRGIRAWT